MRLVLILALLVVACGPGAGDSPPPTGQPTSTPTSSPTAPPTPTPTPTATATEAPRPTPTGVPTPTTAPTPTARPTLQAPPPATLAHETSSVTGWIGTYCWSGLCSDVFQLPPSSSFPLLETIGSAELTFSIAESGFYWWAASYGNGGYADLLPLGHGGEMYDPDTTATAPPLLGSAAFAGPPAGDWIVLVSISAPAGQAQYAWNVVVPET